MEWLVALVVIATVVALTAVSRARRRPRVQVSLGLHPDDLAELRAVGERLVRERRAERTTQLAERVKLISARGVPVRGITPTSTDDQWLLRFADGSVIVVRGRRSGDPWWVVRHLLAGTVALSGHRYERGALLITLDAGARRPEFFALGEV